MDSRTCILIIGSLIIFMIYIFLMVKLIIMPYKNEKNRIREMEVKNGLNEFYSKVDPDKVKETLTDYFMNYINRYIVYKYISNKVEYIKQEDIDPMIKDITKSIAMDISELYIYYIKLIVNITDTESLIKYIHETVMELVIEAVSDYNKQLDV